MKVQILGVGCARCQELERRVRDVLSELNIPAEIEHLKDIQRFAAMGVFMTPGLVIDGRVVSQGRVLSKEELKKLFSLSQS